MVPKTREGSKVELSEVEIKGGYCINKMNSLKGEVKLLKGEMTMKDEDITIFRKINNKYESILKCINTTKVNLQGKKDKGEKVVENQYKELLEDILEFVDDIIEEKPAKKRKQQADIMQKEKSVRKKNESKHVQQDLVYIPNAQLKSLKDTDLHKKMNPRDKRRVEKFFDFASLRTVAFDVDENLIEMGTQKVVVVGEILEQLLHKESVESEALHFYIHRRKLSCLKDHAKFDGRKYLNCAYMDPSAWSYVDRKWRDKNRLVDKFIVDMADNLDRLLIPMNNICEKSDEGKHWTLLVFDFGAEEWQYYNSLTANADKCLEDAKKMALEVTKVLNMKNQMLKKKQIVNPEVRSIKCPQQGSHPDCLLYTCYFMKRCSKTNKQIEWNDEKLRGICHDMRYKMVTKMLRPAAHAKVWDLSTDEDYKKWCKDHKIRPQH